MTEIKGQTVLITGASRGIGAAAAREFAAAGANVVLMARSADAIEEIAAEIGGLAVTGDVADYGDMDRAVAAAVDRFGGLDILINNAGLALGLEPLYEGDIDQWEEMIDANIKGLLYVSRAVIPQMKTKGTGHVVHIGSIAGEMAYPGGNVYCATKAAVHSLSKSMNIDLQGTGVRVSNVAPGAAETNFSNTRFSGDSEKAGGVYAGYEPLKADDIAELIIYILNAPEHVNIQETLIMPTAQRNPYVLSREAD